jgi:hypothetical protein
LLAGDLQVARVGHHPVDLDGLHLPRLGLRHDVIAERR